METLNAAEISVAREVLVFDVGHNPQDVSVDGSALVEMLEDDYAGGVAQFRVDHAAAIQFYSEVA
jgi:hypothetical protein